MPNKSQVLEDAIGQTIDVGIWQKRMKEGVLVQLTIKHWRARKKLALGELGIYPPTSEARDAYEQLLTLGSKRLLPQQTLRDLDAIERGARQKLAEYAYQTPFGAFVPYTTYPLWKKDNEEYKARFFTKRDEIVSAYTDLVAQLLAEYERIAAHTYQLLMSQVPDYMGTFPTAEEFIAHFREEVIFRNIKTAEEFSRSFVYEETLSRIPLLNSLETQEVTAEEVDETILIKQVEIEAAQQRKRELEEMNRDLVRKAREQKEAMIDSFLTSLVSQLRGMTYEAVTSVLASIKEQETLQGRPVIQLKNLIEQLRNLNFYGDADIDAILTLLHSIIVKPAKERNIPEITRQLRSIATLTRGTVLALGEQTRIEKDIPPTELGISAEPTHEDVREARLDISSAIHSAQFPDTQREEREERQELVTIGTEHQEEQRHERTE